MRKTYQWEFPLRNERAIHEINFLNGIFYILRIEWAEMICSVTYKKLSQIIDLIRRPRKILDNDILRAESFWKLWVS